MLGAKFWPICMTLPNFDSKFIVVLVSSRTLVGHHFILVIYFTFIFLLGLVHPLRLSCSDLAYLDCLLQNKICIQVPSSVKCVRILIYSLLYLLFIMYTFVSPTDALMGFLPIIIKRKKTQQPENPFNFSFSFLKHSLHSSKHFMNFI